MRFDEAHFSYENVRLQIKILALSASFIRKSSNAVFVALSILGPFILVFLVKVGPFRMTLSSSQCIGV
jgi:hypothetical protein